MRKMSRRFWNDLKWARNHHTDLLKKYRDKWIAVLNRRVVSFGTNLEKVEEQAKKKTGILDIPVMFVECGAHIYAQKNIFRF